METNTKTKPMAILACYHIVNRYRRCPNFAYVMRATESMQLVQSAIREYEGKPDFTFEERWEDQKDVSHDWKGIVCQLEAEVKELESKLESAGDSDMSAPDSDAERAMDRVRRLVRDMKLRGADISPEQLEDAIKGRF